MQDKKQEKPPFEGKGKQPPRGSGTSGGRRRQISEEELMQARGRGRGGGMRFGKPKDARGTFQQLMGYLRPYIGRLALVMVFSLVSTIVSIIATRIIGSAIDKYIAAGNIQGLVPVCIGLLSIYLAGVMAQYFSNIITVNISTGLSADLRTAIFGKLQRLQVSFFDTNSSGDIMSRVTNDVDTIGFTFSQAVVQVFNGVVTIVTVLTFMLIISPIMTLVSLISLPLIMVITRSLMRVSRRTFLARQRYLGEMNGYVEEMVSGQKVIKLFGREKIVEEDFSAINEDLRITGIKAECIGGVMGPMMNMLGNMTYLIVSAAGGAVVILSKGSLLSVGGIFSFLAYQRQFSRPINELANLANTIQSALAGAERVFNILNQPEETDDEGATVLTHTEGKVEIENIHFSYEPGKPVMKDVSLQAAPGEQVAIVGPTGAGKTTIISLLTRFYDIDEGRIMLDDKPLRSFTRNSLRKQVGMVLQDTYLFSETVRDNIRYGRPDATDEEVIQAAKMANAHSFISHLPDGYDTILGDNGGDLSQGQRQLLAIARVILTDPGLLILDEATSSIDTRTEINIQTALLELMKGRTSFIIAHRLSTIKNADKIVVIDQGEVVEQGTHTELLEQNGFYADLYNSQFKTGMAI